MTLPWFEKGLRFGCKRCGACCRRKGAFVWLTMSEAQEICDFLGMPDLNSFMLMFIDVVSSVGNEVTDSGKPPRLSIRKHASGDCPFWSEAEECCAVYPARPSQCESFPWWRRCLTDRAAWDKRAERCPGMNHGQWFSQKAIARRLMDAKLNGNGDELPAVGNHVVTKPRIVVTKNRTIGPSGP